MVYARNIGRIKRNCVAFLIDNGKRNAERRNRSHRTIRIDDRLNEPGYVVRFLRVQAVRTGEGAKIKIKGAILLEQNEYVFDVLPDQS